MMTAWRRRLAEDETRRTAAAAAGFRRAALQKAIARLRLHRSAVHHARRWRRAHVARAFGAWRSSAAVRSDRRALLSLLATRWVAASTTAAWRAWEEQTARRVRAAAAAAAALNAWRQQGLLWAWRCLSAVAAAARRRTIASLLARTAARQQSLRAWAAAASKLAARRAAVAALGTPRARSLRRAFSSWAPLAPVGRQRKLLRQAALSLLGMRAGAALRRWLEAATARRHNFFAFGVALNLWSRSSQWAALLSWRAMVAGRRRDEATLQWAIETILDRSRRRAFLGWGAFLVRRRVQSHQLSTAVGHWRGDVALMPAFATLHHHAQTSSAAAITVRRWRFTTLSFAVREWREAAERRGALVATLGDAMLRWRLANVGCLLRSWRAEAALLLCCCLTVQPQPPSHMHVHVLVCEFYNPSVRHKLRCYSCRGSHTCTGGLMASWAPHTAWARLASQVCD